MQISTIFNIYITVTSISCLTTTLGMYVSLELAMYVEFTSLALHFAWPRLATSHSLHIIEEGITSTGTSTSSPPSVNKSEQWNKKRQGFPLPLVEWRRWENWSHCKLFYLHRASVLEIFISQTAPQRFQVPSFIVHADMAHIHHENSVSWWIN
jgi:hypothetical protein